MFVAYDKILSKDLISHFTPVFLARLSTAWFFLLPGKTGHLTNVAVMHIGQGRIESCIVKDGNSTVSIEVMTQEVNGAEALTALRPQMRQLFTVLAGEATGRVEIIFNEAVNNAFRQGNKVRVKISRIGRKLILRVKDSGHGFAGNLLLNSLCCQDMEQLFDEKLIDEGGRGLLIMKAMADEVCFNHQGNEIMLIIKLGYNN